MTRADSAEHMRGLCHVLDAIMRGEADVERFRAFARDAIRRGRPVRTQVLTAPEVVVETEIRFIVLAIPRLSRWHGDARAWLNEHMGMQTTMEGAFPWNITCGGTPVAPPAEGPARPLAPKSRLGRFVLNPDHQRFAKE